MEVSLGKDRKFRSLKLVTTMSYPFPIFLLLRISSFYSHILIAEQSEALYQGSRIFIGENYVYLRSCQHHKAKNRMRKSQKYCTFHGCIISLKRIFMRLYCGNFLL